MLAPSVDMNMNVNHVGQNDFKCLTYHLHVHLHFTHESKTMVHNSRGMPGLKTELIKVFTTSGQLYLS